MTPPTDTTEGERTPGRADAAEIDALAALTAPIVVTEERRRLGSRTPAPPAHFAFRWLFPLLLIGLAVTTALLGLHAKDLVLNSRDGSIARNVTDPAAPGFAAEVVPTPTLLVAQTTDKGELVGVAIMSLASSGGGGGTAMFFPADLVIKLPNGDASSLAKVYADAGSSGDAGAAALRLQIGRLIDADLDSTIVLGSKTLADLIKPVAPLRYNLLDNVRAVQNGVTVTLLKAGPVAISTVDQVQAATEILSPGESTINRMTRQIAFWEAWLAAVRSAPDPAAVLPPFDTGLPHFAKGLATGPSVPAFEQAPFTEQTFRGLTLLTADTTGIRAITSRMIPYPQAYQPGARLLVEVRNGVGDLRRNEPMNRKIVAAGGQIVVLGNAEAFGVATTTVVFYDEAIRSRVEDFARSIGVPSPTFVDRPGSSIEVTVTIGADFTP